jgi:leucyl-tRNA synthetase
VGEAAGAALELRRAAHRAIAAVTEDLESLRFNRAVAQIYTLANAISSAGAGIEGWVRREALEALTVLIGPMMPHVAESCWEALGHTGLLAETAWPAFDPSLVKHDTITIAVQVNGKLRGTLDVAADASDDRVREGALALEGVTRAREGRAPRRVIVVPKRIVNIVA